MSEQDYLRGEREAYLRLIRMCLNQLTGSDDGDLQRVARMVLERQQAMGALRDFAEQHGISNDWPDGLHMADVIEKRIARGFQ